MGNRSVSPVQAKLGDASDFTISLDVSHSPTTDISLEVVKDVCIVDCNGSKIDLNQIIGSKGSWNTLTLGLSRDYIGGYILLEFFEKTWQSVPYKRIGTAIIPLEITIVLKKTHQATYSVSVDPSFRQVGSMFYQFQQDIKFEATLNCILESEFQPDAVTHYIVVDEKLDVETHQPYTDTHASYNTAKLQMVNQKAGLKKQYVVLTLPDMPHISAIYWLAADQIPRCAIIERIAGEYFTLWRHLNTRGDAPKKVWKSLRRLAESTPVEGGLGLKESFWGYKDTSAQVNIENIPKDNAHAPDRLVLRTSSGRGGLRSSADYMDIFYASKTGSMQHLQRYVQKDKINVNKKDENGNLPVYYAALCGQYFALKFLFENGAQLDLSSIDGQRTWLAAHSNRIRELLRAKSTYSDMAGNQAILQKAFRGTVSEIQSTVNNGQVNVNFVGAKGLRAIDYACVAENVPAIEFLKKNESFDTLISGFRSMIHSGDHHDVVIHIGGQRIKAHRILLLSACSYFPQIIGVSNEEFNKPVAVGNNTNTNTNNNTNDTKEVHTGPIEVTVTQPVVPLDAYALRTFVHYLYFGAIDWFSNAQVVEQLAALVKKYDSTEDFDILKKYTRAEKITLPKIEMPSNFGKSLLSYVNNEEFHDVVLEIHGKQIYAHKVILAARSQYFDAMFSSDMVEAKQYVLAITDDISVEVFLLVLEFIYTDQIADSANLSPTACLEMIMLAHKYMLTALKAFLDDFICSNFDIELEDALDSYTFAAELKVERFRKKCARFIKSNIRLIENLPSFKELSIKDKNKVYEDIVE